LKIVYSIFFIFYCLFNLNAQKRIEKKLDYAQLLYTGRGYKQVLETSNKILKNHPNNFEALRLRGSSNYYLENKDLAYYDLLKYSEHFKLDSSYFNIWLGLKNYYEYNLEFHKAMICSKNAILTKPKITNTTQFDPYKINTNKEIAFSLGGKAQSVELILSQKHVNPRTKDSVYTKSISTSFINHLDPNKNVLLKADINRINDLFKTYIIDIKNTSNAIFKFTNTIYKYRLTQIDSFLNIKKSEEFIFNQLTEPPLSSLYNKIHSNSISELSLKWNQQLHYLILSDLFYPIDSLADFNPTEIDYYPNKQKSIDKATYRIKQIIKEKKEYKGGTEELIQSCFLNAVSTSNDPHSNYFTKDDLENFEETVSKEKFSFGLTFERKENEFKIKSIQFGSSAWLNEEFKVGNTILKVKPKNKEKINLELISVNEINNLLLQFDNDIIEFTIRNGANKIIIKELTKTKIPSNNFVRSYILNGPRNLGYVHLPSFYGESENFKIGCGIDLMNEIVKFEKTNIKGLILDLRNNAGGNLFEVEYISSIFLNKGKYAKLKNKNNKDFLIEETPTGACFDLPLLILVNNLTASASEVLTGILKLHNRAIVVGTNTFGKFTGQIIMPLLPKKIYLDPNRIGELGYLKVTNTQVYLNNGISPQKEGLTPDILLPFLFQDLNSIESTFDNTIPKDTIGSLGSFYPLKKLPVLQLSKLSKSRLDTNTFFNLILDLTINFNPKDIKLDTSISLVKNFSKQSKHYNELIEKVDFLNSFESMYSVDNHSYDLKKLNSDKQKKEIDSQIIKNIKNDIYINESYHILNDMIDLLIKHN
jgi:carboxyl-terminal processing protease